MTQMEKFQLNLQMLKVDSNPVNYYDDNEVTIHYLQIEKLTPKDDTSLSDSENSDHSSDDDL